MHCAFSFTREYVRGVLFPCPKFTAGRRERTSVELNAHTFCHFTEDLADLKKDDYAVYFANFSDNETRKRPLFLADFISVGKHIQKEKLHDCLDLIQILISEQFVYETCVPDGRLEYLLPADRHVFQRLAEYDSLYESLYSQVDSEENGILRYGKRFYEDFYTKRDLLLQLLWERTGWKP